MKNSLENIFELKGVRAGGGGGGRDSPYSGITFNTANFEKKERAGDAEKSSSSTSSKKVEAYSRQSTAHPVALKAPDAVNGVGNDSSYNIHSPHGSSSVSK